MPGDLSLKALNFAHRGLVRLTGGRFGWQAGHMPVLELTTVGRKSGARHTVMLASPVQEGAGWVVVGSCWGADHHPAWFLNLRDRPEVEVSVRGEPSRPMRARIVGADERARLWPRVVDVYKNYARYQADIDREIPLVVLEPLR